MLWGLLEYLSSILFFFMHITSAGSFPKALTAAEEKKYLEQMAAGDHHARQKLIEHNLRLVAHIAKKYYADENDRDDLVSIGTVGLIKAVDSFDPTKGIRLSSYASRCIENAILLQMRLWFRTNPPRAEKKQNGVFWHRFPKIYTSFVPLRTAMCGMPPCISIVSD